VCLHALDWYESERGPVDGLLLLQPTSPFRSRASVERAIECFRTHEHRPVVAVYPAKSHPMSVFRIAGDTMVPYLDRADLQMRSQDLPEAVAVSGALYLIAPDDLRRTRSFYEGVVPLLIETPAECIDIDTEWDWTMAETFLATRAPAR
jgi:CMP-N,N'-diacetyllegionaminic acid synthase